MKSKKKFFKSKTQMIVYLFLYAILFVAFIYFECKKMINSKKYFELALEFYSKSGNQEKICEMKFNIANIYYF